MNETKTTTYAASAVLLASSLAATMVMTAAMIIVDRLKSWDTDLIDAKTVFQAMKFLIQLYETPFDIVTLLYLAAIIAVLLVLCGAVLSLVILKKFSWRLIAFSAAFIAVIFLATGYASTVIR